MSWDYAEANPLNGPSGSLESMVKNTAAGLLSNGASRDSVGIAGQADAAIQTVSISKVLSTDPPYYDNIGYADLSDFFYVWLRRSLKPVFPELFATLAVPKTEELVATPYRHGSKEAAETFFLSGMTRALRRLSEQAHPGFPVTIYYAFKQSETKGDTGIGQHRLGDVSGCRDPVRVRDHRHVARYVPSGKTECAIRTLTPSPPASCSSAAAVLPPPRPPRAASS